MQIFVGFIGLFLPCILIFAREGFWVRVGKILIFKCMKENGLKENTAGSHSMKKNIGQVIVEQLKKSRKDQREKTLKERKVFPPYLGIWNYLVVLTKMATMKTE